jgi:hypothetical protein
MIKKIMHDQSLESRWKNILKKLELRRKNGRQEPKEEMGRVSLRMAYQLSLI